LNRERKLIACASLDRERRAGRRKCAYRELSRFPAGTGQSLTGRAYVQAKKLGARMLIPSEAVRLDRGRRIEALTVVVANHVPTFRSSKGAGCGTGASPIQARLCRDEEMVVVGGGKSAAWSATGSGLDAARGGSRCRRLAYRP
jgi:thioredoxin reductase (NADPH)